MFLIVLNYLLIYQYFKKSFSCILQLCGCLQQYISWFDLINEVIFSAEEK